MQSDKEIGSVDRTQHEKYISWKIMHKKLVQTLFLKNQN